VSLTGEQLTRALWSAPPALPMIRNSRSLRNACRLSHVILDDLFTPLTHTSTLERAASVAAPTMIRKPERGREGGGERGPEKGGGVKPEPHLQ
jgi:hypothetical protein